MWWSESLIETCSLKTEPNDAWSPGREGKSEARASRAMISRTASRAMPLRTVNSRTMPSKTIAWRGPGLVAFGGPASPAHRLGEGQEAPLGPGGARKAAPCHLESFRALIDAGFFGRRPSTLTPSLSAVEKFFETG